jgi:hypothetical protein
VRWAGGYACRPCGYCACSAVQCSAVQCSAVQCSAVCGCAWGAPFCEPGVPLAIRLNCLPAHSPCSARSCGCTF